MFNPMRWLTLVLSLIPMTGVWAQSTATTPPTEDIRAVLQRRIQDEKRGVGIVVGVIDPAGKLVIGAGSTNKTERHTPDGDTVFEIGSVTKVFTGLLLADMVQRGAVSLTDPVSKYLPKSVNVPTRGGREITLLDLVTHTSALPRLPANLKPADGENPYADYTVDQLYASLAAIKLERDIGSKYEYSNLGTGLLGHALALHSKSEYETLLSTRIFEPLGMTSSMIRLSPAAQQRLAPGHDKSLLPTKNWDLPTLAAAGAIRSTVNDVLKFLDANLGRTKSPLDAAMTEQLRTRRPTGNSGLEIALGWHVTTTADGENVWHNGETGGYHSFVAFNKKRGVAVVVLSNSANDIDDIGLYLLDNRPVKKNKPQKERGVVNIDPQILETYVGDYELLPTFVIAVTRDKDQLAVQATGQPKFLVFPESEKDFFLKAVDAQITFEKNDQGVVTSLILHQNGRDQRAKKRTK